MAPLVISMVPMLQSTSKKSGNVSRNRRSDCIVDVVPSSRMSANVSNVALLFSVVLMQKILFVGTHQGQKRSREGKAGAAGIQEEKSSAVSNLCCS